MTVAAGYLIVGTNADDTAAYTASAPNTAQLNVTTGGVTSAYTLVDVPSDPLLLSVVVNGTPYLRGDDTWQYDPVKNQIVFVGALCDQIRNNTPDNPVRLDIRLLKIL